MRKIILFSAMSIDGFIAIKDGNLDWLYTFDTETEERANETKTNFFDFYNTIETTFIGNNTYKQMMDNGDSAPFSDKENFVFTKTEREKTENAVYVTNDLLEFISIQKENERKKDIWLVGGGLLNSYFLQNLLIDEIILDVIPIVLGDGIRLFEKCSEVSPLQFNCTKIKQHSSGVVQQFYVRH